MVDGLFLLLLLLLFSSSSSFFPNININFITKRKKIPYLLYPILSYPIMLLCILTRSRPAACEFLSVEGGRKRRRKKKKKNKKEKKKKEKKKEKKDEKMTQATLSPSSL